MLNLNRLAAAVIFTCVLTVSFSSAITIDSETTAAKLVRAVRASENWIHEIDSLYIRVESKSTKTPEGIAARRAGLRQQFPDGDLNPSQFPELKPVSTAILENAFDENRVRSLSDQRDSGRELKIWDGRRLMVHEAPLHEGQEQYTLSRTLQGSFQDMLAFETSWPRAQPHTFWWDDKDIDELLNYYGHAEDSSITGRCDYRGVDCYVLDIPPRGIAGLVIVQSYPGCKSCQRRQYGLIGEARGLAGQSYRWYVGAKDHRLYGLALLSNKKPRFEYWMLDYREVKPDCWLPMVQGCEVYEKDVSGRSYVDVHTDLKVVDIRINEPWSDELFEMEFKEGVKVVDSRYGRTITYTHKPSPPNLIGKALPEFVDIETSFTSEQANDRRVLVCFWDMQQRPSRYYIGRLAERAGYFAEKGIAVVCVHASGIDENTLNEWMKKYNIQFTDGMVRGDEEKIRFMWGVKSLPWLLLTDGKHIVQAEGFSINELNERIATLREK
ncbi:MAG: TlpA family protein disulfide reductase [Planctomycetota bacterium]